MSGKLLPGVIAVSIAAVIGCAGSKTGRIEHQQPTQYGPASVNTQRQQTPSVPVPAATPVSTTRRRAEAKDALVADKCFDQSAVTAKREMRMLAGLQGLAKCKASMPVACEAEMLQVMPVGLGYVTKQDFNTEAYDPIAENQFLRVTDHPLSTFSIDVDVASYSNIRRFLNDNTLPPKDAVRLEEMINYFAYTYPQPTDGHPFSITTEMASCPWDSTHRLVLVGLQGKKVALESMPPSNLVFLLDVSGSMDEPNKLPLLKMALSMLVKNLRPIDHVAITVYAGAAGLVLPSTAGDKKETILAAIDNLQAGGSTAGGAGIQLAYKVAKENFIRNGNNRVILATDGDFNIGASSDGEMVQLIEEKRNDGVFLSVLGFGTGNYKDSKMQKLADKGNGNYAYIDNILEAKKVLVSQMGGTLLTIAKDVKIQIEFNPAHVGAYRLIGYEKRRLNDEDFNDDTKDAGEMGSGHTVTALYEVVPAGQEGSVPGVDPLKYQKRNVKESADDSKELLTVKFRYKDPDGSASKLITATLEDRISKDASENLRFASAVAGFGMLLRDSKFKGSLTYQKVIGMARSARGADAEGYRVECVRMMERAELLAASKS